MSFARYVNPKNQVRVDILSVANGTQELPARCNFWGPSVQSVILRSSGLRPLAAAIMAVFLMLGLAPTDCGRTCDAGG